MDIPEFIQKLTSIRQKDIQGCPTITDVIDEILEFIGDDIIVAHNISFDLPFINSVLRRLDRPELENKSLCTNVMTKHMIPEIMSSNLTYMSQLFDIDHNNAHRAYDDALATAKLLLKYLEIFAEKGIKKINQLYYPRNKFELDRVHFDNNTPKEDILKLVDKNNASMLFTFKGERGLIMAVLPLEQPKEQKKVLEKYINKDNWNRLTVRLMRPMLEGILQFNNHFLKYPEDQRQDLLNYLQEYYELEDPEERKSVQDIDFILSHHLVKDQIIVYNFLNLNTHAKSIFKFPAQRKKLINHLNSLSRKFENQQKGKKKTSLNPEMVPIVENFLHLNKPDNKYLYVSRKQVKEGESSLLKLIEEFINSSKDTYRFPTNHI
jgi:DNA polymerase-3 subunit epsilon